MVKEPISRGVSLVHTWYRPLQAPRYSWPILRRSFAAWVDAMTVVARDAGARPAMARRRAEDALVSIQGGLIFSRATGDTKPFERALADLPATLVGSK